MTASASIPCHITRAKIYGNANAMRLLVHIMLMMAEEDAAHSGDEDREAGVLVRSTHDLGAMLRWNRGKVVRGLDALRNADAIKTRAVPGGTEIKCLYYVRQVAQKHKAAPPKRAAPPAPKRTIEERVERFTAACKAVCDADPSRLPDALRKEFHAYWTEQNAQGVMRFEKQPFFDHGRRMDTWRRNAESKGFGSSSSAPSADGKWNPRA